MDPKLVLFYWEEIKKVECLRSHDYIRNVIITVIYEGLKGWLKYLEYSYRSSCMMVTLPRASEILKLHISPVWPVLTVATMMTRSRHRPVPRVRDELIIWSLANYNKHIRSKIRIFVFYQQNFLSPGLSFEAGKQHLTVGEFSRLFWEAFDVC